MWTESSFETVITVITVTGRFINKEVVSLVAIILLMLISTRSGWRRSIKVLIVTASAPNRCRNGEIWGRVHIHWFHCVEIQRRPGLIHSQVSYYHHSITLVWSVELTWWIFINRLRTGRDFVNRRGKMRWIWVAAPSILMNSWIMTKLRITDAMNCCRSCRRPFVR